MLTRQPPPPDFEWTAESIRALRSHLGQSQAALARELGIRQQTVSEWETGMYKPRGASVTILTLLAVSSGFQFDLPVSRETSTSDNEPPRTHSGNSQRTAPTGYNGGRQIRGPRTHPDWIRTSAVSHNASRTRNFAPRRRPNIRYTDGEIPL